LGCSDANQQTHKASPFVALVWAASLSQRHEG